VLRLLPTHAREIRIGDKVEVAIRPEDLHARPGLPLPNAVNTVAGELVTLLFCGSSLESKIRIGEETVLLDLPRGMGFAEGAPVSLEIPPASVTLWLTDSDSPALNGPGAVRCHSQSERMAG
jgi:hypothetical protein